MPGDTRTTFDPPNALRRLTRGDPGEAVGSDGLRWWPALGLGWLGRFDPTRYDENYWRRYQELDRTPMGRDLTLQRAAWVRQYYSHGPVLDFGVGGGAFVAELRSRGEAVQGFDINAQAAAWLQQHDAWCDPYSAMVPALTCWDSLEHVPDIERLLWSVDPWLFVSLPVVPLGQRPGPGWRHYRPGEHLLYASTVGFIRLMYEMGFVVVGKSRFETEAGRQDIETFAFRRRS